jgi:hypothetical protein
MEMLLRACVEDVRKEIARRQIESAQMGSLMKGVTMPGDINKIYGANGGRERDGISSSSIPIDSFAQEDRERALELLLSQERVVTLLYSKVFPANNNAATATNTMNNPNGNSSTGRHGEKERGGKLVNASLEELLHVAENEDDEGRPATTGGMNLTGTNNSNNVLRPHTLSGGEDLGEGKTN